MMTFDTCLICWNVSQSFWCAMPKTEKKIVKFFISLPLCIVCWGFIENSAHKIIFFWRTPAKVWSNLKVNILVITTCLRTCSYSVTCCSLFQSGCCSLWFSVVVVISKLIPVYFLCFVLDWKLPDINLSSLMVQCKDWRFQKM